MLGSPLVRLWRMTANSPPFLISPVYTGSPPIRRLLFFSTRNSTIGYLKVSSAIITLLADDMPEATRESSDGLVYIDAFQAISKVPNQLLAVAEENGRLAGTLQP